MNIAFIVTNYNNSIHSENLVRSFAAARVGYEGSIIVIVDNASSPEHHDILAKLDAEFDWVHVLYNEMNSGYFPGLNLGLDYVEKHFGEFDFLVVGNNDLLVEPNFIASFERHQNVLNENYVTCPSIISADGSAQNPHVVGSISRFRWLIWEVYYLSFFTSKLVKRIAATLGPLARRKDRDAHAVSKHITTGYGACYILNRDFLMHARRLFMPTFLMHEEYFLSHQLKQFGQKPYFFPHIRLFHREHASVSTVSKRLIWDYERASYLIMRDLEKSNGLYHQGNRT